MDGLLEVVREATRDLYSGFNNHVPKPVEPMELFACWRRCDRATTSERPLIRATTTCREVERIGAGPAQ